jgi:hypothetical protein
VTSGRQDKQIQVYDPAIAGKQAIVQKNAGQADQNVGNKNAGQNVPVGQGARSAGGGHNNSAARLQQQGAGYVVQHQGGGSRDITKMMEILPLRGRDISNLSSNSTSKTSSMCSTIRSSSSKK